MSVAPTDGVSAVNDRGEVLLFVDGGPRLPVGYAVEGAEVRITFDDGEEHVRTYGALSIEALEAAGRGKVVELASGGVARVTELEEAAWTTAPH